MNTCSIILGKNEQNPLIEIRAVKDVGNSVYSKIPNKQNLKSFASIAAQAAPSLLTQAQVTKSSIMEVIVNGSLTRAADGNGFRAMVQGADGKIIENARLYNADSLSNLVNAAAIWQITSVIVAQKHLADINQKLDDLKDGIDRIQNFQQVERQTKIYAIANYLNEKISLLMLNDNLGSDQNYLCDINDYYVKLDQIFLHLKDDINKYGLKKIEHKEMVGSADFKKDMDEKIIEIQKYIDLAYFCLNLKSTCVSILDYSGKHNDLVEYKFNSIRDDIDALHNIVQEIRKNILLEINDLNSYVNKAQSYIKNNKEKIIETIFNPIGSLASSAIEKIIIGEKTFSYNTKADLLEERKKDMTCHVNRCLTFSIEKSEYSKNLTYTTIQSLIEKEQPIKLAFQKLDENYMLCLNTNEKILIK